MLSRVYLLYGAEFAAGGAWRWRSLEVWGQGFKVVVDTRC